MLYNGIHHQYDGAIQITCPANDQNIIPLLNSPTPNKLLKETKKHIFSFNMFKNKKKESYKLLLELTPFIVEDLKKLFYCLEQLDKNKSNTQNNQNNSLFLNNGKVEIKFNYKFSVIHNINFDEYLKETMDTVLPILKKDNTKQLFNNVMHMMGILHSQGLEFEEKHIKTLETYNGRFFMTSNTINAKDLECFTDMLKLYEMLVHFLESHLVYRASLSRSEKKKLKKLGGSSVNFLNINMGLNTKSTTYR